MYLTHYCRVEHPERLVGDLRHSIRALADLALAHEHRPLAEREAQLRAAVGDLLATDAKAHGCTLDEARIRELLSVDTALNAQGLEVWLRRRARGRPHRRKGGYTARPGSACAPTRPHHEAPHRRPAHPRDQGGSGPAGPARRLPGQ